MLKIKLKFILFLFNIAVKIIYSTIQLYKSSYFNTKEISL